MENKSRKRRRIANNVEKEPMCGQAHPKHGQSVDIIMRIPECGQAQPECEDEDMCEALDRVEMCYNIVMELVVETQLCNSGVASLGPSLDKGKLCHTQASKEENVESIVTDKSRKRKLYCRPNIQPSEQPRKKRSKCIVAEKEVATTKLTMQEVKAWWQAKFRNNSPEVNTSVMKDTNNSTQISKKIKVNLPNLEKENRSNGGVKKSLKGKTKSKHTVQKTKITKFYQVLKPENSGLETGAVVQQNSSISSRYANIIDGRGGRNGSVLGEGWGAAKLMGLVTNTSNSNYELSNSGGPLKLDVEKKTFAVRSDSLYTDEELNSIKLEMHL